MVKISIGRENLTIKLEGAKKLLAVKSSITIPFEKIADFYGAGEAHLAACHANTDIRTGSLHGRDVLAQEGRKDILLCKGFFKMHHIDSKESRVFANDRGSGQR